MKRRIKNPVARCMNTYNRPSVVGDKRRSLKAGYIKHKRSWGECLVRPGLVI